MAKIKWVKKQEIEAKKAEQERQKAERKQFRDKKFTTLSTKDKDTLLEILAKEHGLI